MFFTLKGLKLTRTWRTETKMREREVSGGCEPVSYPARNLSDLFINSNT